MRIGGKKNGSENERGGRAKTLKHQKVEENSEQNYQKIPSAVKVKAQETKRGRVKTWRKRRRGEKSAT